MKGRPAGQVGSITGPPSAIPDVWDFRQLPSGLTRRSILQLIDTLFAMGPFGFRGPAAPWIPAHLTFPDGAVNTAQVIAPGYSCPSNDFLSRSLLATGDDLLYIDQRPQLILERHGSMHIDDAVQRPRASLAAL
jgi:hypothetical protein